jgi:hypothetical protein
MYQSYKECFPPQSFIVDSCQLDLFLSLEDGRQKSPRNGRRIFTRLHGVTSNNLLQLEYLDATVLRRGVGEMRVVVGRDPACWQGWRVVCSHWKQTNDLSQQPSTFRNGLGEPLRSFSWTVSSKYYNYTFMSESSRSQWLSTNCFRPLEHCDRGFESHWGMDVCVCSVCVFSVST